MSSSLGAGFRSRQGEVRENPWPLCRLPRRRGLDRKWSFMPNPMLKTGCYLIRFTLTAPGDVVRHYDGVLRVTREDQNGQLLPPDRWADSVVINASADLYQHYLDKDHDPIGAPVFGEEKERPIGIPYFPRANYRYYLKGIEVVESPSGAEPQAMIRFETYQYDRE